MPENDVVVEPKGDWKGERVLLEDVLECVNQANADSDERDEMQVHWNDVIETPVKSFGTSTFQDRIGQRFELELGQYDAQLILIEVDDLGKGPDLSEVAPGDGAPGAQSQFRLIFRGMTRRALVTEGWYRLRGEGLGEFELYLSPAAREHYEDPLHPHAPHLEAVFC